MGFPAAHSLGQEALRLRHSVLIRAPVPHQRDGNRRQRTLRNPLRQYWPRATPLRPVHSSACNAKDTVLSRCNLGGSRVRASDWRMRSFGPLCLTLR